MILEGSFCLSVYSERVWSGLSSVIKSLKLKGALGERTGSKFSYNMWTTLKADEQVLVFWEQANITSHLYLVVHYSLPFSLFTLYTLPEQSLNTELYLYLFSNYKNLSMLIAKKKINGKKI